jgi:phosphodiesterase/alkaline phosphatase D-like protein
VTSSWTEGGVTWNNPPTANGTAEATTAVGSTGWKSWTITDLVADWHDGTVTNYGVQVKKSSGSPPDNVQFHSSDYTTDTTRRPKLVVDYTAGNGQPPTAVTLNDLSNITSYSVDLSWSQNQDEDFASYKIYRDTSAGVDTNDTLVTTLTTQSTTSYTNTGLSPSTTYYYKVYVFDTESLSSGSNEKSGTTQQNTAPTAVTLNDLSNLTSSSVDLSWSQNQDGDFASYKIYRDTSAGVDTNDTLVTTITNQGTTSYTNTGLSPSTTYYYKVYVGRIERLGE